MTFLNATLLFGVAAIAAPIMLHFLARREPKKVVFPSVRFLVKRFETNRSRLQIRRWWLLALRVATLAALALALARPAIHRSLSLTWMTIGLMAVFGFALAVMASVALVRQDAKGTGYALGGGALLCLLGVGLWSAWTVAAGPAMSLDQTQPVAIAIVFDNAPTAAWKTATDDRLQRMRDLATWMVSRLPRGSRIAIVDRSQQVPIFSLDAGSVRTRIDQLRPLEVVQPIAARLEAAARLLRTSDLSQRQVLLITDLAIGTWHDDSTQNDVGATFLSDPPIALTLFDLGQFEGLNRSLTIPQIATHSAAGGATISTRLELSGERVEQRVSVTAELELFDNDPALPVVRDGVVQLPQLRSVDRASVSLSAGESRELVLQLPSLGLGTHHGRVRLIGEDALPVDDVRYFSIASQPPSRVLLVGDDEDEAKIISLAVAAPDGVADSVTDEGATFVVERIAYDNLAVVRLEDFDAVMLLDPPRAAIDDPALLGYIQAGGGVLIALGPSVGTDGFDSQLLPRLVRRWRSPDPGTFLQVTATAHPITQPLASDTPWSDFRVHQYWQVETSDQDRVLADYVTTPHAAVVERTFQSSVDQSAGRMMLITTPIPSLAEPTRDWNELFGTDPWPAWLLIRNSVEFLTGRGVADRMVMVGQPQTVRLPTGQDAIDESPDRLQLFRPQSPLPTPLNLPEGADQLVIRDVARSGTYWVRGLASGEGFSANLSSDWLQTERIDRARLDRILGAEHYRLATRREQIEFVESEGAPRVLLAAPAILLALMAFLLEQILSNRFYRQSTTAAALTSATRPRSPDTVGPGWLRSFRRH
jgi:hypothetical protein